MCFCALFLPCTTCFYRAKCDDLCCTCVNNECHMCDFLAREDWRDLCCCLSEKERLNLCDACEWYRVICCVRSGDSKVHTELATAAATAEEVPVPARM